MRAFLDDLPLPSFKMEYDEDFVTNLREENSGKPQSWLVNKAIEEIARKITKETREELQQEDRIR